MDKELFTQTMNSFFKDWLEMVLKEAFAEGETPEEEALEQATGNEDFADSATFGPDEIDTKDPSFAYGKQLGLPRSLYVKKNPLSGKLLPNAGDGGSNMAPVYNINITLGGYGGS